MFAREMYKYIYLYIYLKTTHLLECAQGRKLGYTTTSWVRTTMSLLLNCYSITLLPAVLGFSRGTRPIESLSSLHISI